MKTCQQKSAKEQLGRSLLPIQVLSNMPHRPRRTQAKTPNANSPIAVGTNVPAAQSATHEK